FFFFQAEDGIRDRNVTGVQTCALPISHLDAVPPGEGGVVRFAAPVVATPRCFLGASEGGADHEPVGAAGDRLDQVPGAAQPAVSDDVHVAAARLVHVVAAGRGDIGDRAGQRHLD